MWITMTSLSIALFAVFVVLALVRNAQHTGHRLTPLRLLLLGVFLADFFLLFPSYYTLIQEGNGIVSSLFMTLHDTIQLFTVGNDFTLILENGLDSAIWQNIYVLYGAFLYAFTPVLTFGFILSLVRNVSSYAKYMFRYFSEVYVFSALSERAMTLAESAFAENKRITLVFLASENSDESLKERACRLGGICFVGDVHAVRLHLHSKKSRITFFFMQEAEQQNIKDAAELLPKYTARENTFLYVFAGNAESELLLNTAEAGKAVLRRVDVATALVHDFLYEKGHIFFDAEPDESGVRRISVAVLGLGAEGSEFARALPWFCQMDGYRAEIHVFEEKQRLIDRFAVSCPELLHPYYNGKFDSDGEAQYLMQIHPFAGESKACYAYLRENPHLTHIIVAEGSDEDNIRTVLSLRTWLSRFGVHPKIYAVVLSADAASWYGNAKNYAGQPLDIAFIGGMDEIYSVGSILHSELDKIALARHLKWGDEASFWKYEYNYSSSVASAIHLKMKKYCRIPGIEKDKSERTEQELWAIRRLEHRRWNAYMRAQGYCSGKERNNLGKVHPCLVDFKDLPEHEQEKDDD